MNKIEEFINISETAAKFAGEGVVRDAFLEIINYFKSIKNNKIEIPIGENTIVAEVYQADPEIPTELTVYIKSKNGVILQDICLVREHYDVKNGFKKDNNSVDCLVWGESYNEDFTDDFRINIVKEEDYEN